MTLLVTGATGFVMSVLAHQWLESYPDERVIVLDASAPDEAAQRYFAPLSSRMKVVTADVTRPDDWRDALRSEQVSHVVHGATVTPLSRGTVAEAKREPEAENPGRIIDVNVMGTVAILDWVRSLSRNRGSSMSAPARSTNMKDLIVQANPCRRMATSCRAGCTASRNWPRS